MNDENKAKRVDADRLCDAIIDLGDWFKQNAADIPVSVRVTYWMFLIAMRKFFVKMVKEKQKWKKMIS